MNFINYEIRRCNIAFTKAPIIHFLNQIHLTLRVDIYLIYIHSDIVFPSTPNLVAINKSKSSLILDFWIHF